MEPRHQVSRAGIELIKTFEGLRRRAARLPNGGFTIGYGHTRSAREGAEVDEADAEALLRYDLLPVEAAVNASVFTPLTENQYDALVAFAFSVGVETFRGSNVLRRVNEGDLLGAAAAFEGWRRAEFEGEVIVVDALIRRRSAEKALFLTPTDGFIASPSTVLRPQLDFGAPVLRQASGEAAEIHTALDGDTVVPERAPAAEPPLLDEPSPAQAAAAAVSRRLQALFADEPARAPDPAPTHAVTHEPDAAVDPFAAPAEVGRPPELRADLALAPWAEPAPGAEPRDLVEVLTQPPGLTPPEDAFDRSIARAEPEPAAAPAEPREPTGPYLILGLLGLAVFGAAIYVVLQGQAAGATSLTDSRSIVGGILGLIGILAFCTAIYYWLSPGRRDDA